MAHKRWVVNQQPPTVDTEVINAYLSRYICRIGISDKRLHYEATTQTVTLSYKDYRKQEAGQAAPEATHQLSPLLAMANLLQHVLPAHFHRTRAYGLHAANTRKRLAPVLERYVRQTPDTVLVLLRLLKEVLRRQLLNTCEQCGSIAPPRIELVAPDRSWLASWLGAAPRPPPVAVTPTETLKKSVV